MDDEPLAERPSQAHPFDVALHTAGLPGWLVEKLVQYLRIMQRNWHPAKRAQNTHRFWSGHLRMWRFLCEKCGVKEVGDLKREHVFAFMDARLDTKHTAGGINTDLNSLRGFLRFLKDEGMPVSNRLLRIRGLKQPDCLPRALTDEQVRKVRDVISSRVNETGSYRKHNEALMAQAAFTLLWQGGMRLGEVENLRLADLDIPGRLLVVRDGKGMKDRVVYLSQAMANTLSDYLSMRGNAKSDNVFLYRQSPLKKDLLRSHLKAAGEQAGVKVKIHGLRHTCATQLLNAGCPVTSIQAILGHKRLNTTMIYARANDKTVEQDYFAAMGGLE